ncbi:hypothetical protein DFS34DRAFT_592499 [Phlyctochytrium arcticum]|nr:hypothetical protein DFS34DRAFT_592499 [Phlyctochytrium arcticum]
MSPESQQKYSTPRNRSTKSPAEDVSADNGRPSRATASPFKSKREREPSPSFRSPSLTPAAGTPRKRLRTTSVPLPQDRTTEDIHLSGPVGTKYRPEDVVWIQALLKVSKTQQGLSLSGRDDPVSLLPLQKDLTYWPAVIEAVHEKPPFPAAEDEEIDPAFRTVWSTPIYVASSEKIVPSHIFKDVGRQWARTAYTVRLVNTPLKFVLLEENLKPFTQWYPNDFRLTRKEASSLDSEDVLLNTYLKALTTACEYAKRILYILPEWKSSNTEGVVKQHSWTRVFFGAQEIRVGDVVATSPDGTLAVVEEIHWKNTSVPGVFPPLTFIVRTVIDSTEPLDDQPVSASKLKLKPFTFRSLQFTIPAGTEYQALPAKTVWGRYFGAMTEPPSISPDTKRAIVRDVKIELR